MRFSNRAEAGRELGRRLAEEPPGGDVVVLGLPRGGVLVAAAVAEALDAPLDVLTVRKLAAPGRPELAVGAVATGGIRVLEEELLRESGLSPRMLDEVTARELGELDRREHAYRPDRPPLELTARTAVLVDDGLATGATMRAAVLAARQQGAAGVVVAVPVSTGRAVVLLRALADRVVVLHVPDPFGAVSASYADFDQTTDEEVRAALAQAGPAPGPSATP
jgi:predicted phosphoribosyltransferase